MESPIDEGWNGIESESQTLRNPSQNGLQRRFARKTEISAHKKEQALADGSQSATGIPIRQVRRSDVKHLGFLKSVIVKIAEFTRAFTVWAEEDLNHSINCAQNTLRLEAWICGRRWRTTG